MKMSPEQQNPSAPKTRTIENRRKKQDVISRAIGWINALAWLYVSVVFIVILYAKPADVTLLDRMFSRQVRSWWLTEYLVAAFYMLLGCFVLCCIGIVFNLLRHRRKTDRYNTGLFIVTGITLAVTLGLGAFLYL